MLLACTLLRPSEREWTTHSVQWEPVSALIAGLTQNADAVKVSYLWCLLQACIYAHGITVYGYLLGLDKSY